VNDGVIGCDLDPQTTVKVNGNDSQAAQGCPHWQTTWPATIAKNNPDVVAVLLGRWESLDRFYDGKWTHVGDPLFDRHLISELGQVIDLASTGGAHVVFLTLPYIAALQTQPNGLPWSMDLPSTTNAYNADVRAAVAQHPGTASLVDLNHLVDPAGRYTSYVDGVRIRDYDDEHFSASGGKWLRPVLLPFFAQVGAHHFHQRPS
jgi:hypothetical protein